MNERFQFFFKSTELTKNAFSVKTGIAYGTLTGILADDSEPTWKTLDRLFKTHPELSAEWLCKGKGEMHV